MKNYCICHGAGQKCDPALCHCTDCYNYEDAPPLPDPSSAEKTGEAKKRRK